MSHLSYLHKIGFFCQSIFLLFQVILLRGADLFFTSVISRFDLVCELHLVTAGGSGIWHWASLHGIWHPSKSSLLKENFLFSAEREWISDFLMETVTDLFHDRTGGTFKL